MWGVERVSSRREKILVGTSGELEEERKTPESTDSFKAAGNGVFVASQKKKQNKNSRIRIGPTDASPESQGGY